ncbi:MAG: hypothetical protein KA099_11715 [Alphaproteobacteria bacterium]|nr:hypothetical protein [Alphaproteobacteria bacterium]MBP7760037.1 hypothetical protein [Alphaproteobacteria bacterium]MBP7763392.1 hypothetical protein [Alphaproteobacteria bacterium]MBP7905979.1 hypothetical protein [Alphaproteobacteria bacterium]
MTNHLPHPIKSGGAGVVASSPLKKFEDKKREPCDFEHWGKMVTWTLPQAHGLCFGIAPIQSSIQEHSKLINLMVNSKQPYQQEMFKVWNLIKNAYDSFILHDTVKPIKFIQWAGIHDVAIPKELRDSAESIDKRRTSQQQQSESTLQLSELEYIPPYMCLMLKGVKALNLSSDTRASMDDIMSWLEENWPSELEGKSERMIKSMATFLRRPEDKKGGITPS